MRAYVLVNATPGRALELAQGLRDVQGVQAADAITGEYDIVVTCEAADIGVLCLLQPGLVPPRSLYLETSLPSPDHSLEKRTPGLCPVACATFMSEQPDPLTATAFTARASLRRFRRTSGHLRIWRHCDSGAAHYTVLEGCPRHKSHSRFLFRPSSLTTSRTMCGWTVRLAVRIQ